MMARKPLMLKDFLELDPNSDSCNGFPTMPRHHHGGTTVRYLLNAELSGGGGGNKLVRSRSKTAMTKLSAVINAVRLLPLSNSAGSRPSQARLLPRSFSRKLRRSFWKCRVGDESERKDVRVKDIVRLRSFDEEAGESRSLYLPSPVVSSCSSWSEGDSAGSHSLPSSLGSSEFFPEPPKSPSRKRRVGSGVSPPGTPKGEMDCPSCQSEEEKEQLSPVSVMDFPYDEEEEEDGDEHEGRPDFQQTLANIERKKQQLLQKIRRFECLAELDPVDLDSRFADLEDCPSASVHVAEGQSGGQEDGVGGDRAWELLRRLDASCRLGQAGAHEKLLADFFVEGLDDNSCGAQWAGEEALLRAAREWIDGGDCMGEGKRERGDAEVREMDRNGGWRSFEDGKREVAAEVEFGLIGWLVEELVLDLVC